MRNIFGFLWVHTFSLVAVVCLTAPQIKADVIIDSFAVLDSPNDFARTNTQTPGITVEVADNNGGLHVESVESSA